MGFEELENAVVNRSLRTVKTELEFLLDAKVITSEQYNTITNQLPASNTQRSATTATTTTIAQPVAQETPTVGLANLNINNGHTNEKANDYYSQPAPVNHNPPPPAYPAAPVGPVVLAHATALYQYNAQDAGDLQLMPNDHIQVTEYMNAEWWKGRNERTGQEGIFPRSYVKVVEDKAPIMPAATPQPTNYGNMPLEVSEGGSGSGKEPNKGAEMGKKFGKKLGNAAIFGAGATIGSNIVNGIF